MTVPGLAGGVLEETAALRVDGDVVGGAYLRCDGDVEIVGHVVSSRVEATGSVTVHGACSGGGACIRAGGDLFVRKVDGGIARAGGDLVVSEGVLRGRVEAEGRFIAREGAVVLDSEVIAARGADCWSLEGASAVMVGVSPQGRDRIAPLLAELERTEKRRGVSERDVSFCLSELERLQARSPRAATLRARLRMEKFRVLALWREAEALRSRLAALEGEFPLYASAQVVVRGIASSGTRIVVGWQLLELDADVRGVVFWSDGTGVQSRPV